MILCNVLGKLYLASASFFVLLGKFYSYSLRNYNSYRNRIITRVKRDSTSLHCIVNYAHFNDRRARKTVKMNAIEMGWHIR